MKVFRRYNSTIPKTIKVSNLAQTVFNQNNNFNLVRGGDKNGKLSTWELLVKLGYIKHPHAGLTHWLPLGLEVLRKLDKVINDRLKEEGLTEVSLSSLSHSSIWTKTNRWNNGELFKLSNESSGNSRKENDEFKKDEGFCLAATCEEEITELVKSYADTYKKLPVRVYQITRKYRDEKRSRGGLLRGREFIMKDAYTFDNNKANALKSFELMNLIYSRIFTDLKLPFVSANADSGSIGGDLSYEWHFQHKSGEDLLLSCNKCGVVGNVERVKPMIDLNNIKPAEISENQYFLSSDHKILYIVYYPHDCKLNFKTLVDSMKEENIIEDESEIINFGKSNDKLIEIFEKQELEDRSIIRIMDPRIQPSITKLPDITIKSYNKNNLFTFQNMIMTDAKEGDLCNSCQDPTSKLIESKGIEVGHTFYLGDKYSKPLDASFIDKDGLKKYYEMGCFGIGVSRIIGAISEITRDDMGLRWPSIISPFHLTFINMNNNNNENENENENTDLIKLYQDLNKDNIEFEIDQSDLKLGSKLKKSKSLGIPLQIIIGKKYPIIEIEVRGFRDINISGDIDNKEYEYIKLNKQFGKEWNWEYSIDDKNKVEKHFVDIKHSYKVIKSLLKDL
ncbi:ligase activity protein [[Candida] boidinii]|nr:ligase activity protein [[Candida] boidinii]